MIQNKKTALTNFRRKLFSIVILAISIIVVSELTGQEIKSNYKIFNYGVEDGLSQGSVYGIFQDHLGFVWMTSYEGLNRFDGNTFEVFKDDLEDEFSIDGNNTIGIVQDSNFNLWIGTEKCLNKYEYTTGKFYHFYVQNADDKIDAQNFPFYSNDSILLFANDIEGIISFNYLTNKKTVLDSKLRYKSNYNLYNAMMTKDGIHVWVRNENGLILFDLIENSKLDFNKEQDSMNNGFVHCLDIDSEGNAWVVFDKVISVISTDGKLIKNIAIPPQINSKILDIKIREDGTFWLGTTKQGLFLIHNDLGILDTFKTGTNQKRTLVSDFSSNMYIDKTGNLWGSSDPNGVFLLQEDNLAFELLTNIKIDGHLKNMGGVKCFTEEDQMIIIGTKFNQLLYFDPTRSQFSKHPIHQSFQHTEISALHYSSNETLWIGTYDGLYSYSNSSAKVNYFNDYNKEKENESKVIWSIVEDGNGNIYFSTSAGIYTWSRETKQISQLPIFQNKSSGVLFIDSKNNLFLPWHNNGFAVVNLDALWNGSGLDQNVKFQHYFPKSFNVKCIEEDTISNTYWIGSTYGIYHVDFILDSLHTLDHYGAKQGLPSNYIYGLLLDGQDLWFSCNRGIGRIDADAKTVRPYSLSDGLQGLEYNSNSFFKDKEERFYFGGVNGFNTFFTSAISDSMSLPQAPIIEYIEYENSRDRIYQSGRINREVGYKKSSFRLYYTTPNFQRRSAINYAYRINEGSWIDLKTNKVLDFNNLSPGEYSIQLKSYLHNLTESSPVSSLEILVNFPWYRRTLFYFGVLFTLFIALYSYFKWRTKDIRLKEGLRSRLAETRLQALQSQMNPHFVFNCLNTIDGFIASNEREQASKFLGAFSKIIRRSLHFSRRETVSLTEELAFIKQFIELEQKRKDRSFEFNYNIQFQDRLTKINIPPLIVQPFIENAIKHGLQNIDYPRILSIYDGVIKGNYVLFVADNGVGFDVESVNEKNSSLGLNITKERLNLYNLKWGMNYHIKIISIGGKSEDRGTVVKFTFAKGKSVYS